MSADNYYDVFAQNASWYAAHKFASDCWYGDHEHMTDAEVDQANLAAEMRAVYSGPRFATQNAAVAWASEQFTEYGVHVRLREGGAGP